MEHVAPTYHDEFKDISFFNWQVWAGAEWKLITPNKETVHFTPETINFDAPEIVDNVSTRMWMWSLGFVQHIESVGEIRNILRIFIRRFSGSSELMKLSSWDHCAAIRINTMLCLLSRFSEGEIVDMSLDILRMATEPLTEKDFARNNHGMMLAVVCIHASVLNRLDPDERDRLELMSRIFLLGFLRRTFDDQGWCNENTPGYQDFFRKFLGDFDRFLSAYSIGSDIKSYVSDLLLRIDEALRKTVLPNGNIPPIGESGHYTTRFSSIPGRHTFLESGLHVNKSKDVFVSVICGSRSETHKQMDDTSICLWAKGADLLVDSGLYNYNVHDPISIAAGSQRGHSGLYFGRFDAMMRPRFIRENPGYLACMSVKGTPTLNSIWCNCAIPELRLIWTRYIQVENLSRITIHDVVSADDASDVVRRFIVPGEAVIEREADGIVIRNGEAAMTMNIGDGTEFAITSACDGPVVKGWRSRAFAQKEPSQVLEIFPKDRTRSRIDISIH